MEVDGLWSGVNGFTNYDIFGDGSNAVTPIPNCKSFFTVISIVFINVTDEIMID